MTTPTTQDTKQQRVSRAKIALEAFLALGPELSRICAERERLLNRARRNGLRIGQSILMSDGQEWELRKAKGKFVHNTLIEFKPVPRSKQTSPRSKPNVEASVSAAPAEASA